MGFLQIWQASVDQDVVNRVKVAVVKAAIAISAEPAATPNHANRGAYARSVLMDPDGSAKRMTLGVVTDAAVQATRSDEAIYNAVAGQWNAYAGVAEEALAALAAGVAEPVEIVAKRSIWPFGKKAQA